ncbi:hypothetical protein ACIQV3_20880 [Streptomyces sp. NPDC099050]|uniref:hypothetical protein n=1 Tax=Streptomyces sp. NPDC099050 TaxID=3366100 RepID=UPI0037F63226
MDTEHRPVRGLPGRPLALVLGLAGALALAVTAPAAAVAPPDDSSALTWGQTRVYDDGLAVTVARPSAFTPSDTSAGHRVGHQAVAWKITLKNGTTEAFKMSLVSVYAKYGTAGERAERVFDSAKGIGSDFEGSISRGRSATATYVFDIPKAAVGSLDIEAVPDIFDYEGTHWTGPLNSRTGPS